MRRFDWTHQGDEASLLTWLADYSSDGGTQFEAPQDQAPALGLDGELLGSLFPATDGSVEHRETGLASNFAADADAGHLSVLSGLSTGLDVVELGFGSTGPGGYSAFTDSADEHVSVSFSFGGLQNGPAPVSGGQGPEMLTAQDLIFLDFFQDARGGNSGKGGGNGGGGGGDGGGSGPNVLSEYISGAEGGYNIQIDFKGSWTAELQQAFIVSADLLSSLIVGDVADVFFRGKVIDDITIKAELADIDGEGGILGMAGPTAIRTADYLPATATMQFDVADADVFNGMGLWEEIVMHEMMHSVGFGTIWDFLNLVDGSGTDSPTFSGEFATMTYEALFDAAGAAGVPLEQDGGAGTVESHWDEETFGDALMTGYINLTTDLDTDLLDITVASLEDLGYDTVWTPDPYLVA